MSKKFVRSTKNVENIQSLSKNLFDENDIVSTNKSEVYIKSKDDFIKLLLNSDLDELNEDIKKVIVDIDMLNKNKESVETSLKTNTEDLKKLKEDVLTTDNKTKENEGKINKNIEDIESINTKINKNIDDITAINNKINSSYKLLFEGTAQNVGTSIKLNDDLTKYKNIVISGIFDTVPFSSLYSTKIITKDITVQQTNLINADGNGGGNYECLLELVSNTEFKIANDVFYDFGSSKGSGANANKFIIKYIEGYK